MSFASRNPGRPTTTQLIAQLSNAAAEVDLELILARGLTEDSDIIAAIHSLKKTPEAKIEKALQQALAGFDKSENEEFAKMRPWVEEKFKFNQGEILLLVLLYQKDKREMKGQSFYQSLTELQDNIANAQKYNNTAEIRRAYENADSNPFINQASDERWTKRTAPQSGIKVAIKGA